MEGTLRCLCHDWRGRLCER